MRHELLRVGMLAVDGPRNEVPNVLAGLVVAETPSDDLPTPDVDCHVQVEEDTAHGAPQVRDVPRPNFVRAASDMLLRSVSTCRACVLSMRELPRFTQHSVEGRLAGDVLPSISRKRHDLPRREVPEFGTVRGVEDELPLRAGERVGR